MIEQILLAYSFPKEIVTAKIMLYKDTKVCSPDRYTVGWLVWFVGVYGISTFVGYLTPNPFLCN